MAEAEKLEVQAKEKAPTEPKAKAREKVMAEVQAKEAEKKRKSRPCRSISPR